MNACLLDTNAFSGLITNDPRLSDRIRQVLAACDDIFVPSIVFYEIAQKVRLGKWPSMEPHVLRLETIAAEDGYEVLPLSSGIALRAGLLDWDHRDPFDRMIAAVALQERMPLVSSDAAFEAVGVERVWG